MMRNTSEGFTLIELLVAIALLAIMTVIMTGALTTGRRVWESSGDRLEGAASIRAVQRVLRAEIGGLRPYFGRITGGNREPLFDGQPNRFRFVTDLPAYLGHRGMYCVTYTLKGDKLYLDWAPYQQPRDFLKEPEAQEVLLTGIKSARFRYLGTVSRSGRSDWHDSTRDFAYGPATVTLDIEFEEGDQRNWPVLMIAPRITQRLDQDRQPF